MRNPVHILQKTRAGLDINAWLVMILVAFLSTALLGFKMFSRDNNCQLFDIIINHQVGGSGTYNVNESIVFSAVGADGKNIDWDFGDHRKSTGLNVMHSYSVEGPYHITATVNKKCIQEISINITRPRLQQQNNTAASDSLNPIVGPDAPIAASPVNFSCAVPATSYEWSVLNSPNFQKQVTNMATYTFPSPGMRVIELRLNGDAKKVYRKTIQVISSMDKIDDAKSHVAIMVEPVIKPRFKISDSPRSKPLAPSADHLSANPKQADNNPANGADPANKKEVKLYIADEEFKRMFEEVVKGSMNVESFNEFLCYGPGTKVFANGGLTDLNGICQQLYKQKRINIKSVSVKRDKNVQNCVTVIYIDYKKKGGFIF